MKVFVTGATGFVGQPVVKELLAHGHKVLALARNDAAAEAIRKAGARPHKGSLEDTESLKSAARIADGIIHLAFITDFSPEGFQTALAVDRGAIEAIADAIAGTDKPFIITSGTLGYPKGILADETTEPVRQGPLSDRQKSADLLFKLAGEKGFRGMLVRLAPTTHGKGDKGFVPMIIGLAKKNGFAAVIGDGSARWPAVHREDAAVAYRLAIEKGRAGATYNAIAESGVAMNDIAGLIGKHLGINITQLNGEEAMKALGPLAAFAMGHDNPTSSEGTQRELGWEPVKQGLLADMEENYFLEELSSKHI